MLCEIRLKKVSNSKQYILYSLFIYLNVFIEVNSRNQIAIIKFVVFIVNKVFQRSNSANHTKIMRLHGTGRCR